MTGKARGQGGTSRKQPPWEERLRVWVAAGGRCTICRRYLLDGPLSNRRLRVGELAHLVGQKDSPGSPRGQALLLDAAERDRAENLMLLCAGEHQEIDRDGVLDLFRVEELRAIKNRHEDWIRRVTGLHPDESTVVLRVVGDVRGARVELDRATATATVIRSGGRWPEFPLSFARDGVEVDLRGMPGQDPVEPGYWTDAVRRIDEGLRRLAEGVADGAVRHVSVFALARWPLLVHLGAGLDDAYGVEVYQRHRATQGWDWREGGRDVAFAFDRPADAAQRDEAVLVLNVSGTVQAGEVPPALAPLPRWTLRPADGTVPHPDVVATAATARAFEASVRTVLADVEARAKQVRRLHVLAAVPVTAAIGLGRARDPHVHPALVLYDRGETGYLPVLEVR